MTRLIRKYATRYATQQLIRIGDKTLDLNFARIVYRCEVCHGGLKKHNHGLVCASDEGHRGFIHQKEVELIQAGQKENVKALESFYQIVNGKVVIKCQS